MIDRAFESNINGIKRGDQIWRYDTQHNILVRLKNSYNYIIIF
jgi:hypothetical protein